MLRPRTAIELSEVTAGGNDKGWHKYRPAQSHNIRSASASKRQRYAVSLQ